LRPAHNLTTEGQAVRAFLTAPVIDLDASYDGQRPKAPTVVASSRACRVGVMAMATRGNWNGYLEPTVQEPPDHTDEPAPDHLGVVLGFAQMLSGGRNANEVSRFAADHGWLDASGQLSAVGDELARALLQQSGTRTTFRVW
jgi:hypothetical protein